MKNVKLPNLPSELKWSVELDILLKQCGEIFLEKQRADLLEAIDRTESLSVAAKELQISYRKAWDLVQDINEKAVTTLIETSVGGASGGGSRLTEEGKQFSKLFAYLSREVNATSARLLRMISGNDTTRHLRIAVAISLQEAMSQLIAKYTLIDPTFRAKTVYGGSDELSEQILSGTEFDIFIAADRAMFTALIDQDLLDASTAIRIAHNTLCVIGRKPLVIGDYGSLNDLMTDASIKRIAIAQVACPLGRITHELISRMGLSQQATEKFIEVDNSKAVPLAVLADAAEIGIAFANHAAPEYRTHKICDIPSELAQSEYWAAIHTACPSVEHASKFLEYLTSLDARSRIRSCGLQT
jgi:molybdate transport system regulatory protein